MPYKVVDIKGKFKLWNLHKRSYATVVFNSKKAAQNQAMNWMRYRRENPVIVGNRILNIKI